jgi:hypothetical protein
MSAAAVVAGSRVEAAAKEAWQSTLDWFNKYLR